MWEDNNPLSYEDSPTESQFPPYDDEDPSPPGSRDSNDTEPPNFITRADRTPSEHSREPPRRDTTDYDDASDEEYRRSRQDKGYSSRVELMLLEDKNTLVEITDAGKSHEGSGGFIVYTIKTGVRDLLLASRAEL